MSREHRYRVGLFWTGAAHGPTSSYDGYSREYVVEVSGKPALRGSSDPAFQGDAALHNPEDLLIAALSACHMLTYLAEAARAGLRILSYADEATGTMIFEGTGGHFAEVVLRPQVVISADGDLDLAKSLHARANRDCFLARSVNFPVRHEPTIRRADD